MSNEGRTTARVPFHAGESAVQDRVGVRERVEQVGPMVIRDAMPDQHRELFGKLPVIYVGSLDAGRRPWASVLVGYPGFAHAADGTALRIDARPTPADPLRANLAVGAPLGLLGIEAHTRRRNRMNGTVVAADPEGFTVGVDQSFGNCPQYIQARRPEWTGEPWDFAKDHEVSRLGATLGAAALAIVERADTFFVASASAAARGRGGAEGVDLSHRGGRPGFVRVTREAGADVLTVPDFRGNFLFNTLGNLVSHPRAGLLFVDFDRGDLVQLTTTTAIVWEGPEVEAFEGAQRLVRFTVEEGLRHVGALPLRWSEPALAKQLEGTGTWPGSRR